MIDTTLRNCIFEDDYQHILGNVTIESLRMYMEMCNTCLLNAISKEINNDEYGPI